MKLDELDLLIHYDDRAFRFNTPIEGPGLKFGDLPDLLRPIFTKRCIRFDQVFLVNCLQGEEAVLRL